MTTKESIINELVNDIVKETLILHKSSRIHADNSVERFLNSGVDLYSYIKSIDNDFSLPNFNTFNEREIYYRQFCDHIRVPKIYQQVWNQYKFLENLPQPAQKTPLWYEMRNNFITASAGAQALGESKYDSAFELVKKKIGLGAEFFENFNVHHGKKFETIATIIYEYIENVKIGEFGLIPHISTPQVSFLGASPDGICTNSTLDGNFSNLVGRMLEIKCVTSRQINITGLEDGEITPHYYWVQVQLQLECCDLEECDFWQCKLKNYWSERRLREQMNVITTMHTREQGKVISIDERLEYGTMIELMPIEQELRQGEKLEYFAAYIYPTKMDCSLEEKVQWANKMKKEWKIHYPEYAENYEFGKILYYHLEKSHCYLIKRDRKWFNEKLPAFAKFWDQVLDYRNNPVKKQELINQIALEESRKRKKRIEERKAASQNALTLMVEDD